MIEVPEPRLSAHIVQDARRTVLTLSGQIDEFSRLGELASQLVPPLTIDLAGIRFINSIGVREWVRFLRVLCPLGEVKLRRCSEPMVMQFNMIAGTLGKAEVESLLAPYECRACGLEESVELLVARDLALGLRSAPPERPCPRCGGQLSFADSPAHYLLFLGAK